MVFRNFLKIFPKQVQKKNIQSDSVFLIHKLGKFKAVQYSEIKQKRKMILLFFLVNVCIVNVCIADVFMSHVNHMEYYRNRTRPSKAFNSFSTNYFNQNSIQKPVKEKVQCGTRTVDFTLRRGKIVGGSEAPYGAFPWQVSELYIFFHYRLRLYNLNLIYLLSF